ncbi:MAG: Leucine aminopeptidase-related protein [uncultured Sphingosinicella sp.]|uniref:Leucine aminopeptidase-related protein n=1 Tax=uncultured Sphingosinicella sp. TaxID=478748 RepID=A0A6J4TMK9_9SPHN|nr:MAG: Leucine aminopeptidase-related protein [uncultured Sphingosinicella sp.]
MAMKKLILLTSAAFLAASPASAQRSTGRSAVTPPNLPQVAADVSEQNLRAIIQRLVSFGTRHTLSSQTDPRRGIGASLRWTEEEFRRYSRTCGGCLAIATPSDVVTGRRVPTPTKVTNVLAIQRGTVDPNRVVIISGHIDSRVSDVMDFTKDAPGANDDASGTAAAMEAARVLSKHRFPYTIVYAALSGEEQGLLGGKILADYAKAQGWEVLANLNNDIIGNSCGSDGLCDAGHVRVFSEGPRWQGREDLAARQRSLGGENDAPSRNLSRYLDELADEVGLGLDVRQIWRNDRFGRGGDHTELLNAGYPAIRFSVAVENYNWQHQDLRVENGVEYGDTIDKVDFPYLTKVVKLNVAALAALASAPPPPAPTVVGAVSTDTKLTWQPVRGAEAYVVRWRRTDAPNWEDSLRVPSDPLTVTSATFRDPRRNQVKTEREVTLPGIRVDDYIFGVSSVSASGFESPVASAVPGGAFAPYTPPPPPAQ